jgi:hypothetical protein
LQCGTISDILTSISSGGYLMLIVLAVIVTLSIGLLLAGIRLLTLARPLALDPTVPAIDPGRYKPMERLLRDEDIRYLARHGLNRRSIGRMRAERRTIFRKYLRLLRCDFGRIVGMVRLAIVESQEARPDLAAALLRARVFFAYTVILMEMRLSLHAIGWNGVSVDVRPAIATLETMRQQWQSLAPTGLITAS